MTDQPKYLSHLITLSGDTAVGTTSALKNLSARLGRAWRYVSAGDIMRQFGEERGMSIEEFSAYMKTHLDEGYDERCDREMAEYGRQNHTVLDGRLVHYMAPHGYNVLLRCPSLRERAVRRQKDPKYSRLDIEEVEELIQARDEDNNTRYDALYRDWDWPSLKYNCVLNTLTYDETAVVGLILAGHSDWLSGLPEASVVRSVQL